MPMTDEIADTVWSWLNDPAHVLNCLIAEDVSGKAIGLAHIRAMPRPLSVPKAASWTTCSSIPMHVVKAYSRLCSRRWTQWLRKKAGRWSGG